jgi:translation initiation factor 4E
MRPPGMDKLPLDDIREPHPLKEKWALFCDIASAKKLTTQNWSSSIRKVCVIRTVEEFWALYQDMPKVSDISTGSTYHFFKNGVEPEWEDSNNIGGGRWTFLIGQNAFSTLDSLWLNTLLALIGNECPFAENICGVIICVKTKQVKLSIWVKHAKNAESCQAIGSFLKKYIGYDFRAEFQAHPDPSHIGNHIEKVLYHV